MLAGPHAGAVRTAVAGPRGRWRFPRGLLCAGMVCGIGAGCGTTLTSRGSWPNPEPYDGVRLDWGLIAHPTYGPCGTGTVGIVVGFTDLPFSLAADTLMLPIALLPDGGRSAGEDDGRAAPASAGEAGPEGGGPGRT